MHVCHIWERFWPLEIGGLERYILWLSHYLAKNEKIDFSLITGRTKFLLITKNIKKIEDAGFLKVYRLGPTPVDLVNGAFMYTFGSRPKLVEKIKSTSLCHEAANWEVAKSADVFHIHGIWGDLEYTNLGVYLSEHFNKPLVVTLHGGFVGDPYNGGMPLESPVVKDILENHADAITTYCKEVLNVLERMGLGKKSHHISNFVDTKKFTKQAPSPPHEITVIYVGRIERVQNPEVVVQAFRQVNKQFPNAKLLVVGYGTLLESIKSLVHELNLDDSVSLLGKQTDVRKFLWNSDIFLATNFGYIASLEAWSAGLAVVAPNFGIMKEVVTHEVNGLLVPPQDPDHYASAIIRLIKNTELRKKLAQNGFETAKNYDIREVAIKMANVYKSVLKN